MDVLYDSPSWGGRTAIQRNLVCSQGLRLGWGRLQKEVPRVDSGTIINGDLATGNHLGVRFDDRLHRRSRLKLSRITDLEENIFQDIAVVSPSARSCSENGSGRDATSLSAEAPTVPVAHKDKYFRFWSAQAQRSSGVATRALHIGLEGHCGPSNRVRSHR